VSDQPDDDRRQSGWLALFGALSMAALVIAVVAVFIGGGGDDGGGTSSASEPVHVSLSEFAIEPAAISVPEGGSLHVTNDGTTTHNLSIVDQDLATADLPAGGSEELDVSSLAVGSYEVLCLIPGHADSGMTGTLEVTAAGETAAAAEPGSGDMGGMDMMT
jgi:plastocyanin